MHRIINGSLIGLWTKDVDSYTGGGSIGKKPISPAIAEIMRIRLTN